MKEGRELISEKKRQSTDVVCLIIFTFFTIILLIAGVYSYIKGSDSKYSIPYDSDGRGCGVDYPDFKYIYFPSPQVDSLWVTTCVKNCPGPDTKTIQCQVNSVVESCEQDNSADNTKAFHIYETQEFRSSICLPQSQTIKERVLDAIGAHFFQELFGSVLKNWLLLLLIVLFTAVVSFILLVLIRIVAGYIIYIFYVAIILAFIGFGIYLAMPVDNPGDDSIFVLKKNQIVAIILAVLSFILSIVMLFIYVSYRQKIGKAVEYISKGNAFLKNNYTILLLPLILSGTLTIFILFWLFLTLSFYSLAQITDKIHQLPYQYVKIPPTMIAMLILGLFYLIWASFFLIHTGRCIISGSLISWRFNRKNPYLNASTAYINSHIGSACLSSLLTSLFGLFKFQVDDADCGQVDQDKNKCSNCLSRCFSCMCCCCVNFIFNLFHPAAFAYLNLSGLPFCQSSKQVYAIIKEEKLAWSSVSLLYTVFGDFIPLLFFGGNMIFANFLVNNVSTFHDTTSNRLLLLLVVGLISYTVSQFFISIYSEAFQSEFILREYHKDMSNKDKYPIKEDEQKIKQQKPKESSQIKPKSPRLSKLN